MLRVTHAVRFPSCSPRADGLWPRSCCVASAPVAGRLSGSTLVCRVFLCCHLTPCLSSTVFMWGGVWAPLSGRGWCRHRVPREPPEAGQQRPRPLAPARRMAVPPGGRFSGRAPRGCSVPRWLPQFHSGLTPVAGSTHFVKFFLLPNVNIFVELENKFFASTQIFVPSK